MEDIVLLFTFIIMGISGWFLMRRVDHFINMNQKRVYTITKPSYVILTDDLSDEEILEEVRRFKEENESVRICLYDNSSNDPSSKN